MAKGWESKSVEAQIEISEARAGSTRQKRLTVAEIELRWKKDTLQLSRARVLQQLQADLSPRYRKMLDGALADLEKQLAELE